MPTAETKKQPLHATIKETVHRWQLFHDKTPHDLRTVNVAWPKKWYKIERVERVYYQSDKWHADGDFVDYYHDHEPDIWFWFSDEALKFFLADEDAYCPRCGAMITLLVEHTGGSIARPCGHMLSASMTEALLESGVKRQEIEEGKPPVKIPQAGAILGNSLGWQTKTGHYIERPGDVLCTNPEGTFLFFVDKHNVPFAIIEGPSLYVTARGIVG